MRNRFHFLAVIGLVLFVALAVLWTPDIPVRDLARTYVRSADRSVEVEPGYSVRVRDLGSQSKPALLLLHGSGDSLEAWDRSARYLAKDFRLLAIDLPGHGMTGPDPRRNYQPERMAVVLDRVLDDAGVPKASLVGNSMGGWVAWNYARLRPARVNRLILVDPFGAPNHAPVDLPVAFRMARWPIAKYALLKITPRTAVEEGLRRSSFDPAWIDDQQIDRHWKLLRRTGNRRAMLDQFEVLKPNATPGDVAGISAPL